MKCNATQTAITHLPEILQCLWMKAEVWRFHAQDTSKQNSAHSQCMKYIKNRYPRAFSLRSDYINLWPNTGVMKQQDLVSQGLIHMRKFASWNPVYEMTELDLLLAPCFECSTSKTGVIQKYWWVSTVQRAEFCSWTWVVWGYSVIRYYEHCNHSGMNRDYLITSIKSCLCCYYQWGWALHDCCSHIWANKQQYIIMNAVVREHNRFTYLKHPWIDRLINKQASNDFKRKQLST